MHLRMRRHIKPELLLRPLLLLHLLLLPPLLHPLTGPRNLDQLVPSVANRDTSLRGVLSWRRLVRRLKTKSAMRQNRALMARLMQRTRLRLWNLQERQVSVRPPLPAPCLTLGMQTQGPLLI